MRKPCASCPFRKDRKVVEVFPETTTPEEVMRGIAKGLVADSPHYCHRTLSKAQDHGTFHQKKICIGSAMFLQKLGHGPKDNISFEIAEARKEIDLDNLDDSIPICVSLSDLFENVS